VIPAILDRPAVLRYERPVERLLSDLHAVGWLTRETSASSSERLVERSWERVVDRVGPRLAIVLRGQLWEDGDVAA
jgi:hypothetical protein